MKFRTRPRPNYLLKDGDTVCLKTPQRVSRYVYDAEHAPRGLWYSLYMLPGAVGVVVRARTPCVWDRPGEPTMFANVNIVYMGETVRVRPFHHEIMRISNPPLRPRLALRQL